MQSRGFNGCGFKASTQMCRCDTPESTSPGAKMWAKKQPLNLYAVADKCQTNRPEYPNKDDTFNIVPGTVLNDCRDARHHDKKIKVWTVNNKRYAVKAPTYPGGNGWIKVLEQRQCNAVLNKGKAVVDELFAKTGSIRMDIDGQPYAFMKRLTPLNITRHSMYDLLTNYWTNTAENNKFNIDWKLYSTEDDMLNDMNSWRICPENFDGTTTGAMLLPEQQGIGFPSNCGPAMLMFGKYVALNKARSCGAKNVALYINQNLPKVQFQRKNGKCYPAPKKSVGSQLCISDPSWEGNGVTCSSPVVDLKWCVANGRKKFKTNVRTAALACCKCGGGAQAEEVKGIAKHKCLGLESWKPYTNKTAPITSKGWARRDGNYFRGLPNNGACDPAGFYNRGRPNAKCEFAKCPAGTEPSTPETCSRGRCSFPTSKFSEAYPDKCPCAGKIGSICNANPPDAARTVSSGSGKGSMGSVWKPTRSDQNQWMIVDLFTTSFISGIKTLGQGGRGRTERVTMFQMQYSMDNLVWKVVDNGKQFEGNVEGAGIENRAMFTQSVTARFLRIVPTKWVGQIAMQVGFICGDGTTPKTTAAKGDAQWGPKVSGLSPGTTLSVARGVATWQACQALCSVSPCCKSISYVADSKKTCKLLGRYGLSSLVSPARGVKAWVSEVAARYAGFKLWVQTSKAKDAGTKGNVEVSFKVGSRWTKPQLFFPMSARGEVMTKTFVTAQRPTHIRFETKSLDQWGYWKVKMDHQVLVEDQENGPLGVRGEWLGVKDTSRFWIVGNGLKKSNTFSVGQMFGDDSLVAFGSARGGKYCKDNGEKLECRDHKVTPWDKFMVRDVDGLGKIALIGKDKMCVDNGAQVNCDAEDMTKSAMFSWYDLGLGKMLLRGGRDGKFCSIRTKKDKTHAAFECALNEPVSTMEREVELQETCLMNCKYNAPEDVTNNKKKGGKPMWLEA